MILIAEPVHFGDTHVQVNSAFVAMLKHVYVKQNVVVVAEEKHGEAIKASGQEKIDNVSFRAFKKYSFNGALYWFQKIIGECRQIYNVMRMARKEKPELVVWLCLFPTGHLFLQIFKRFLIRDQQQLVVLHGELEYLLSAKKRTEKLLRYTLKTAFKKIDNSTKYLVLGEGIRHKLEDFPSMPLSSIYAFQHPFIYEPALPQTQIDSPLKVGSFGVLKTSKNAHYIFELAKRFENEIRDNLIEFHLIGKFFPEMQLFRNDLVIVESEHDFLPQDEFEKKIRALDVALFFYDRSMYRLSASGALHQAIKAGVPVFSLKNDYFMNIFQQQNVGACFSTVDEMEKMIRFVLQQRASVISSFENAHSTFIQENSFLLQSERLKTILKESQLF